MDYLVVEDVSDKVEGLPGVVRSSLSPWSCLPPGPLPSPLRAATPFFKHISSTDLGSSHTGSSSRSCPGNSSVSGTNTQMCSEAVLAITS